MLQINAFNRDREKSNKQRKMRNIVKVVNVFHRLIEFVARGFFLLVAYLRGPAEAQPPIKDLTLMHSATALAIKIRNRQVSGIILNSMYVHIKTDYSTPIGFVRSKEIVLEITFRCSISNRNSAENKLLS